MYYSKDTSEQSKIIFGPPEAEKYGKLGSTNDDLKWVDVVLNPSYDAFQQWDIEIASASLGGTKIYSSDTSFTTLTGIIDTGTNEI